MSKKVSIIVPVYNVEKYIGECLYKLVNQTIKDYEIIIVVDGSLDNSINIVKEYTEKYPNIISYYETENKGLSAARNLGLKKAKGEYVGFIDSDDSVSIKMFEKMYNCAVNNRCDIVVCDYCKVTGRYKEDVILDIKENDYKNDLIIKCRPYAWNKIYKKELFQKCNIEFPEGLIFEDISTIYPLLMQANKVGYVKEVLYNYNIRMNSIMKSKNRDDQKIITVLDIMNKYCKEHNLFEKYKQLICEINVRHIYYRIREMKDYNNTKLYNMNFIRKSFRMLDKNFPGWKYKCKYASKIKEKQKNVVYWQLKILLAG